jgi:REP element-mobilizing transposase RayT
VEEVSTRYLMPVRRPKTGNESWHVFGRGARRLLLFYEDKDFHVFLSILQKSVNTSGCLLWAYCLMSNHYHLVLHGTSEQLTRCMWLLNHGYALYHNQTYHLGGHVYEGPYKAYRQRSLFFLIRRIIYVFLNPVAAGMVSRPDAYRWSGYRSFIGLEGSPLPIVSEPVFALLRQHMTDERTWFQWLVEERIKLLPKKGSGPLTAVQVNAEQFQWLLEYAREHPASLGGEDPDMVAMYWGKGVGIPPRAMSVVLRDLTPCLIRHRLWKFCERLKKDPELLNRLTPP